MGHPRELFYARPTRIRPGAGWLSGRVLQKVRAEEGRSDVVCWQGFAG